MSQSRCDLSSASAVLMKVRREQTGFTGAEQQHPFRGPTTMYTYPWSLLALVQHKELICQHVTTSRPRSLPLIPPASSSNPHMTSCGGTTVMQDAVLFWNTYWIICFYLWILRHPMLFVPRHDLCKFAWTMCRHAQSEANAYLQHLIFVTERDGLDLFFFSLFLSQH
jgi:hypothetical protein